MYVVLSMYVLVLSYTKYVVLSMYVSVLSMYELVLSIYFNFLYLLCISFLYFNF